MQRTEYQVDGPLTALARDVLGFGDTAELGKRAQEAEKASHYASVRFQPQYAKAQDVHEGYIGNEAKKSNGAQAPAS
jgi:4-hydroxyphenylacetate 3-monooxygenase